MTGSCNANQNAHVSAIDVVRLLQRCRFDLSSEKHLQADIERVLNDSGFQFEREKRLSDSDIPDFMIHGGIVIECKMRNKARKIDIFKQIARYAEHSEVSAIVLATNVSMCFPAEINGKAVHTASISMGWI